MKHSVTKICVFLLFTTSASSCFAKSSLQHYHHVDWETGLCGQPIYWNRWFENDQEIMVQLAALFEERNPTKVMLHDEPIIPQIIHQIWIGGSVPPKYAKFAQTWKQHHPDWEYKLWTDENVATLEMVNRELFEKTINVGQKADVLRCEILNQFGGLYVDMDFECLKPFDLMHHCYTFYTGFNHVRSVELANGLMACTPGHPLIKRMINNISIIKQKTADWRLNLIKTSGPAFFTKEFMAYLSETGDDSIIAFPSVYFYPAPGGKGRIEGKKNQFIEPSSFAIHYFGHTWWSGDRHKQANKVTHAARRSSLGRKRRK